MRSIVLLIDCRYSYMLDEVKIVIINDKTTTCTSIQPLQTNKEEHERSTRLNRSRPPHPRLYRLHRMKPRTSSAVHSAVPPPLPPIDLFFFWDRQDDLENKKYEVMKNYLLYSIGYTKYPVNRVDKAPKQSTNNTKGGSGGIRFHRVVDDTEQIINITASSLGWFGSSLVCNLLFLS